MMKDLLCFWRRKEESTSTPTALREEPIIFNTDFGVQPISKILVKASEFSSFLSYAVKYGNQEVTAIGTGVYYRQNQIVKVNGIYPILDASGGGASVTITANGHNRLHRTLRHWNEDDEVTILHSHPHFSSFKSQTDDQHAIRMACLLFGGVAVMIIVDPFSHRGVDVSAYAVDPDSKVVHRISFQLVP